MEKDSVWLGPLRQPIRLLMMVSTGLVVLLYVWLVINRMISEDALGMHEMIRPTGRTIVWAMLAAISSSIIFASLYLSDFRGSIEIEPNGFFDILSLITSRMAMIMTALIVIVMFYEVVSRYVFSRPTLWANELSLWIAAFVFLFAGQYAMQQRSHIRIYVVYDIMPRWIQKVADVMSVLLIFGFTFALVWGNFADAKRRMLRMETFGTAWDPPIPGIVKPAILIIIILVCLQAISNLIADWNKAPEHHSPLDEIDETEIENIKKTLGE
jgi:TRAP-type C4-dicarboxylate transport system permease small subunit